MADWLRRLTRKPKVRTAVCSNPALDSLVGVRNSSPSQPEPCEGNLVAAAGSCGGMMVKHPWPPLEISLSDFCRLATLNIPTYLPWSNFHGKFSRTCFGRRNQKTFQPLVISSILWVSKTKVEPSENIYFAKCSSSCS